MALRPLPPPSGQFHTSLLSVNREANICSSRWWVCCHINTAHDSPRVVGVSACLEVPCIAEFHSLEASKTPVSAVWLPSLPCWPGREQMEGAFPACAPQVLAL